MRSVSAFLLGGLFAVGLGIGGMLHPLRVMGFLDVFGDWDLTLAFVMAAAVFVSSVGYHLIRRRKAPLRAAAFAWPSRRDIDLKLLVGAAIFGLGWGATGICPGPGITCLVTLQPDVFLFVGAMIAGMALYGLIERRREADG